MAALTCVGHHLRRQFGLVTLVQLASAGFTTSAIRHLVRTERLRRVYRGVYAAEGWRSTPQQRALAAVLACGAGAALSHISAAVHWRLLKYWPSMPQLTVPGKTGRRGPKGIELHHTLNPEHTTFDHIPITTLPRTLHDIAPTLRPHVLKAAVRQAEIQHQLDLSQLEPTGALRRFLANYVPILGVTNEFEADFLELCVNHSLTRPETQYEIEPYLADFCWPEHRLIVETDGRGSHDGFIAFRDDRIRTRFLQSRGFEVLQFTYEEIRDQPAMVAAEVSAALARRRPAASARA